MISAFNFNRPGFRNQPTSFYARPLWVRKYDGKNSIFKRLFFKCNCL